MKAWRLRRLGGELRFSDVRTPELRPGSALVRIEASALMSYLKAYVEGKRRSTIRLRARSRSEPTESASWKRLAGMSGI
jgi:hypothetical protein